MNEWVYPPLFTANTCNGFHLVLYSYIKGNSLPMSIDTK